MQPVRRIALLLLTAFLLSACSPANQPAPDVSQANLTPIQEPAPESTPGDRNPVTITFGGQDWERSSFQKVIDRFNSENPDVHVQFVSLDSVYTSSSSNMDAQLRQIVSAADTASIFNLTRHAIQSGYVLDLAPLMQADRSFAPADFYPGALESVSLEGKTYMLPRTVWLQLLSYNKDLWDRAGLAAPKPDWSWDDLVRAAEQIARKRGNTIEVYGMIDWGGFGILDGLLSQSSGTTPLDTRPGEGRFDQPELLAALKRVDALAKSGGLLVPNQTDGQWRPPDETIKAQEVDIWWQGMYPDASREQLSFGVGTLPLPRSKAGAQRFSQGYVISSGTQHPEASWRWLSFLSRQQVDRAGGLVENVSSVPARKSVAEQSGYWDKLDPETRSVIEAALSTPIAPSLISFDARYTSALATAVDRMTSGKQTPEEALREARLSYEQALAEGQQTPESAETGPIIVATPEPEVAIAAGASKVRFGTFGFDQSALRKQADEFNRSQSEVFVEIVEPERGGEGMINPNVARIAAVSDAFLWYGLLSPQELTATQDLQPLIDADPEFRLDDYPPALLGAFQQNGKLIGLPRALDLRVVQYNRKAFEQAGVEPPAANWTLDQLIDKAQRLTSGTQPDKQYGFSADGTLGLELVLDASGASLSTEQGGQLKPNFTDPKVLEASRRFIDLARSSSPQQGLDGYRGGAFSSSFEQIRQGRVGMWVSYGLSDMILGSSQMETGMVPPPLGQITPRSSSFAFDGLYLSAQASDPQATWKWMKFLSQSASGLGGRFPARSSVAQSEAFLQQAPPGAAEVFRAYTAALAKGPPPAGASNRQQLVFESYWYYQAVDRVLRGETRNLERALEEAQTLTQQFLDCVRAGDTPPNCAKQTDPSYDGFLLMR